MRALLITTTLLFGLLAQSCDPPQTPPRLTAPQVNLLACLSQGSASCLHWGRTSLRDGHTDHSLRAFSESCRLGNAWGCKDLGLLLKAYNKNEIAEQAYDRGCELGLPSACLLQGIYWRDLKNRKRGNDSFRKACSADTSVDAESAARACTILGLGAVQKGNLNLATSRFQRACEMGHLASCAWENQIVRRKASSSKK